MCGEVVGSKDELIGSEEIDDDGVDEPKHGSGSSPGESRILGRPRFLLTMSNPDPEGTAWEANMRPEIGGGSLEADDGNEVDIDIDAADCGGGALGLCKRASLGDEERLE